MRPRWLHIFTQCGIPDAGINFLGFSLYLSLSLFVSRFIKGANLGNLDYATGYNLLGRV